MIYAFFTLLDESLHRRPHLIALGRLALAINMALYYYPECTSNPTARWSDPVHHADAASSLAVALGIVIQFPEHALIDTMVAVLETAHLMYLGSVFWDSAKGLMDRNVEETTHTRMVQLVENVDGVKEVKYLRSRYVGQDIFSEVVIGVSPSITLAEAHAIAEEVKKRIIAGVALIGSIQVRTESVSAAQSNA